MRLLIGEVGFCWDDKFAVLRCNTDDAHTLPGKSLVDVAYCISEWIRSAEGC